MIIMPQTPSVGADPCHKAKIESADSNPVQRRNQFVGRFLLRAKTLLNNSDDCALACRLISLIFDCARVPNALAKGDLFDSPLFPASVP